jgi:hypothetical protein
MNEYYTTQQAMERLSMRSINGFWQLERKYPHAFVNVNPASKRGKPQPPWYDRATLDAFAKNREYLKQEIA